MQFLHILEIFVTAKEDMRHDNYGYDDSCMGTEIRLLLGRHMIRNKNGD